jgi:hypothetical protein
MNLKVQAAASIHDVPQHEWDALANPDPTSFNPFVAHDFLSALEDSDCTTLATGWMPHHILLFEGESWWALPSAISSLIPWGNMYSTMAGPKPIIVLAVPIIQNFRCRFHLRL